LETLQASLTHAKEVFEALEKERRRVKEALETNKDPAQTAALQYALTILQLESRVAQGKIFLFQEELKNGSLSKTHSESERELLLKKLAWLKKNVRFNQEELSKKLSQLKWEKQEITRQLGEAREALQSLENRLPQKSIGAVTSSPLPTNGSLQVTDILQAERQILQNRVSILAERLQSLDAMEETWRRRYLVFNQLAEKSQMAAWETEIQQAGAQVQRQETLANVRLSDLRKTINDLKDRIAILKGQDMVLKEPLEAQLRAVQQLLEANQDYLAFLNRESLLYQKFLNEISPQVETLGLREKLAFLWERVVRVWNFEITSIDDKPITVKKLVFILILLILGYGFSRRLSRWFGHKILPRFGMAKGVAAGLQTLFFYLMVTLVTLLVLYIVNVPLTMFTVLGGALAIGVGFGSQYIVRNFISGLILLMEQPIKIGDMIQVEEIIGVVEKIGARSTSIRSFTNIHAIVPNSDLLEKKVINWTLSDDLIRVQVNVGVAYGSPVRVVAKLLRQAVDEHPKVIPTPEPTLLFKDFGESALQFEIHFWIKMPSIMDREMINSEIRFRIDTLFREAGITIAFPQRDVHLGGRTPLEVKLVKPDSSPI
jgi:small-conductance mechanosensitive channel